MSRSSDGLLVIIVMGSDSDLPVMSEAAKTLEAFGVGFRQYIASAHRTPERVAEIVRDAESAGARVIIAGAGLSAHLPGVISSLTTLPVIGVPLRAGALNGVDALYSIVQMPPGIPVATVGIDAAKNAAVLAVEIIASGESSASEEGSGPATGDATAHAARGLRERLREYRNRMAESVLARDAELQARGCGGTAGGNK